jgi:hypothetical protein
VAAAETKSWWRPNHDRTQYSEVDVTLRFLEETVAAQVPRAPPPAASAPACAMLTFASAGPIRWRAGLFTGRGIGGAAVSSAGARRPTVAGHPVRHHGRRCVRVLTAAHQQRLTLPPCQTRLQGARPGICGGVCSRSAGAAVAAHLWRRRHSRRVQYATRRPLPLDAR